MRSGVTPNTSAMLTNGTGTGVHDTYLTLGAHAQRGLRTWSVRLFVCLSVCLSVYAYSRSTGYEAAYERYQQLEGYESMKIKKGDFPETTAIWRENKRKSQHTRSVRSIAHAPPPAEAVKKVRQNFV